MTTASDILDCALAQSAQCSWNNLSFQQLVEELDISLSEFSRYFRSKDDLAEALFDRADRAMLDFAEDLGEMEEQEKVYQCICHWFEYLLPYQSQVRDIMAYKLEPGHFHLQAHGITRVSRTVQWFLNASGCESKGLTIIFREVAVTTAFVTSFSRFLWDYSPDMQHTKTTLRRLLRVAYRQPCR